MQITARKHIVGFVSQTRYVRERLTDEQIERVCQELGIREDVFFEACEEYQSRNANIEKMNVPRHSGPAATLATKSYEYGMLYMQGPPEVLSRWEDLAKRWGFTRASLFRTSMHEFLMSDHIINDRCFERGWSYLGYDNPSASKAKLKANVTFASIEAMHRRAERMRVSRDAIPRALFKEVLLGNFGSPQMKSVSRKQMFNDPDLYARGPDSM